MDLELDAKTMRSMVERAMDRIVPHLTSLPAQPTHGTRGGKRLAALLREPAPDRGVPYERLLRLLFGRVIPTSLNTASPGYLAYVPGGGLFHSAVADLIALATNRFVGVWLAAPGLVQLEQNVLAWFASMLGLPETAGGLLTSGGSIANLVAIVTARREMLPPDFLSGVLYTSSEAHHSVSKAALFAGMLPERIRVVATDSALRMSPAALEQAIADDRAKGLTPFAVVANAGSTNTGAVDDLDAIARVARAHELWLHVDAAYGGFFALTDRGREALRGIEKADSVTLDPHKGMFLPYGTGCLLVRDAARLRRAHGERASYMPKAESDEAFVDFCDLGPELSREARGLRVWLPLKMHGFGAFRDALDEKLDLARYLADALETIEGIELLARPALSLLAFRVRADDEAVRDARTRALLAFVNGRQRVLLTGAVVGGRFVARVCILSFRTHRDRIDACIEDIRLGLAEVAREG